MKYMINIKGLCRAKAAMLAAALMVPLAACDDVLEVEDPDIVEPGALAGAEGRNAQVNGAIFDFKQAYDGAAGGGSMIDGFVSTTGYMTDEGHLSGTFPTRQDFDQRGVDTDNGTLTEVFRRMHQARVSLERVAARLQTDEGETEPAEVARPSEVISLAGFMYVAFGEMYCSGVPFSEASLETGELTFGDPSTTQETFAIAIERFDAGLGLAGEADPPDSEDLANLARVGKARAQLSLGDVEAAASTAAAVPTDFVYNIFNSITTSDQENGMSAANARTGRWSISDLEGGNGLPFRSTEDVRLPFEQQGEGFDNQTPRWVLLNYPLTGEELSREAPSPLASGIEARLIEAEAALAAGNPQWLDILNELRAQRRDNAGLEEAALPPLEDPGNAAARVDLLFQERAILLFVTGHRLGDQRRLVRQYGRDPEAVFPTGAYFKGGSYGSDVNFPIPFEEENNPNFQECLDRNA